MSYRIEADPSSIYFRGFEDCNDAILITDDSGKIIYVNSAWERLYEFDKNEAIGNTPKILRSGKHEPGFYKNMWRAIVDSENGHWMGDVINRTKGGEFIPVFLRITTIRRQDQSIFGFIGTATDFSTQKAAEKLQRQRDNLSAIRTFSEGLAHQIGTTLGVIRGRAEFLEIQPPSEKVIKASTRVIIEQADRIQQCVEYLLRFCRSSKELDLGVVKIAPLLKETQNHFKKRIQDLSIDFNLLVSKHSQVNGDLHRMKQILVHLLDNAIDAIEAAKKENSEANHEISVEAEELDSEIKIVIRDTGCGIAEKDLENVFRPFFTKKDIGGGAGLGLSLALALAEDMGARISVASKVGSGSAFTLHLSK